MDKKYFGFEKNVFFLGLTSFLTDTSTKMVYSVMPLFLLSIGASKTTIALIEGIAESTASLLKVISGHWSDKLMRNKPFMILGYGLTAFITPIYSFAVHPVHILYLRFIERIGKGFRSAPRDSLISASVESKEIGKSFGLHKAMDNSGAILGPFIASLLLYFFPHNYQIIFLLAGIPAILGVLSIILFVTEKHQNKEIKKEKFLLSHLPNRFYMFLFIIFLFTLGNSSDALLIVRISETGLNSIYIPIIYMLFNFVSVIFAIPLGKISDKIGREKLISLGFFMYSLVYFGFGFFNNIQIFIFLFFLYGLYSALSDGSQKSMVYDLSPKELKGTAFGLYYAIMGITLLPASLIAGLLYDKINPSSAFYFGGGMSFLAGIMLIVFNIIYKKNN